MSFSDLPKHIKLESVPDNVLIENCPLTGGKKVYATKCLKCKYHDGFVQIAYDGPFMGMYRVLCCHAVPRQLGEIE